MAMTQDQIMQAVRTVLSNAGVPEAQYDGQRRCTTPGFYAAPGAGVVFVIWADRTNGRGALSVRDRARTRNQWEELINRQAKLSAVAMSGMPCCLMVRGR